LVKKNFAHTRYFRVNVVLNLKNERFLSDFLVKHVKITKKL